MRSIKRQAGLSFVTWLIVIAILGVLAVVGIKLTPVYLEYYTVANILEQVAAEHGVRTQTRATVWGKISKRLDINSVKSVKPENFEIKVGDRDVTYVIHYEVRKHILGNLDVVAVFKKQVKAN